MSNALTLDDQAIKIASELFMATDPQCLKLMQTLRRLITDARLVELDLLEQAINQGRDMYSYKLQRLEALTGGNDLVATGQDVSAGTLKSAPVAPSNLKEEGEL